MSEIKMQDSVTSCIFLYVCVCARYQEAVSCSVTEGVKVWVDAHGIILNVYFLLTRVVVLFM